MPWITLDSDDLSGSLTALELTALSTFQLPVGASNPVPQTIADVSQEVRGYIAARPGALLDVDGTIPPELKSTALAIARWRILTRLAAGKASQTLLTESRRRDYEDAVARLRDVAAGKFYVAPPDTVPAEQPRDVDPGVWGSGFNIFAATSDSTS